MSSINDTDASENETSTLTNFERGRWYRLRLRVTDDEIQAWIDGEEIIYVDLAGKTISLRWGETNLSTPFGIAAYATTGAIRNLEYRLLAPSPLQLAAEKQPPATCAGSSLTHRTSAMRSYQDFARLRLLEFSWNRLRVAPTIAVILLTALPPLFSQPAPARGGMQAVRSPEVSADGRVTFRLRAPNAKEVFVTGIGQRLAMQKDEPGRWRVTTEPVKPASVTYSLVDAGATGND
ncbi:MAG: hypothetical protein ACUVXB_17975, partial [Bryobacteraceae bacterium]